jgi:ribosomal protein L7/L12
MRPNGADNSAYLSAVNETIKAGEKMAKTMERQLKSVGRSMEGLGRTMSIAVTAPILAAAAAMTKAAVDANETRSKFNVVFRDIAKDANITAEVLKDSFGLGATEAQKLLGDTGDLLTGFGFTQQAALDMSTQVQKLAVDLASFTNIEGGTTRASKALTFVRIPMNTKLLLIKICVSWA